MRRKKRILEGILAVIAVAALVAGGIRTYCHDRAMHAALLELQEWNQADTVFRSDSVARVLVAYFDHPWHSSNTRMLAHYLLGRAHADMGEAPQAIEAYQTAIERADTTDSDCDFRILRNIYGQMAEVYGRQGLITHELDACIQYGRFSSKINDIYEYARNKLYVSEIFYAVNDTASAWYHICEAKKIFQDHQMFSEAAQVYASPIHEAINQQQFDKAESMMMVYERESGLFDRDGNIQRGREIYYFDKGVYYLHTHKEDSAEYMFRKLSLFPANSIDYYRGLLMLFRQECITDSIFKYALLYEEALSVYLHETQTEAVAHAQALYNYNRHKQQAQIQRRKVVRTRLILIAVILLFSTGGLIFYQYVLQRKRKRERAYQLLMNKFLHAQDDLKDSAAELSLLREHLLHSRETELLLAKKESQLSSLQSLVDQYKETFKRIKAVDRESILRNSDIVLSFREMVEIRTIRQGSKISLKEKQLPTQEEWQQLYKTVQHCLPFFYSTISSGKKLTEQEWKATILFRIGFKAQDVATLLDTLPSRVSKLKSLINEKLFNQEYPESLIRNLNAL